MGCVKYFLIIFIITIGLLKMIRFKLKEMIAEKEFQQKKRITIKEIAESTSINRMTLSKILNHPGHSTTTENVDRLCVYFECKVEDLMIHIPADKNLG